MFLIVVFSCVSIFQITVVIAAMGLQKRCLSQEPLLSFKGLAWCTAIVAGTVLHGVDRHRRLQMTDLLILGEVPGVAAYRKGMMFADFNNS